MKKKEVITALGLSVAIVCSCGKVENMSEDPIESISVENATTEDTNESTDERATEESKITEKVSDIEEEGTKTEEEVVESDIEPASGTYYAKQACNLRSGPSTDYEKVGSLAYKQEIQVTGRSKSTGWYELEMNGQKVYVSDKLITTEKPVDQKQSGGNSGSGNSSTTKPSGGNSGQQSGGNSDSGSSGNASGKTDEEIFREIGAESGDLSDLPSCELY